ncbi:HAD family hydrolase [Thiovibrio sp. JS02]
MGQQEPVTTILFDFGGVVAEEGFTQGLAVIAAKNSLRPEAFFETATEIIYGCGFVTGKCDEHAYWHLLRRQTGIGGTDTELSEEILSRFILRPAMLAAVRSLRQKGINPVVLSDQTDWLDRLEERHPFSHAFTRIFNSFYLGKTKRDPSVFGDTLAALQARAENTLFVDDNAGHIGRASALGLQTHLFRDQEAFLRELTRRGLL